ncbi:class I SAM-dependent methyltransferase [Sporohalobacter salinus]|uniref:class I SAM-dependent methyltransferase n=1 Tax=Sporohalobacter salinus TaxID=1494606 RepID=UPI00196207B5|nr:class I SAM-dependent methyltransferase [Sporohalobacter salinus]MBM7624443.1 SAM-dependent methyltransferase [Sporohalobacter salinus]
MQLPPQLYHWLIRPKWLTNIYINDLLKENFTFENKKILDFGCGVGSTSSIFNSKNYLGVDINQKRIEYAQKLHQILKPTGRIIVIEPCFCSNSYISNYFMNIIDNGNHIRSMNEYFKLFQNHYYKINPITKYKKLFFYNDLFFTAIPA